MQYWLGQIGLILSGLICVKMASSLTLMLLLSYCIQSCSGQLLYMYMLISLLWIVFQRQLTDRIC